MKLQTKVFFGYFFIILILTIAVLVTMLEIKDIQKVTHRIENIRTPTAVASSSAYSGVYHSLSSLRAWMLLGKDQYKDERALAWQKEIRPSIATLKTLSTDWTNHENIQRLEKINALLSQFELYQQEIESIAQTSANVPSIELLFNQAVPLAEGLYQNLSSIIDLEEQEKATSERKKLFKTLADTRGSFAVMLATIRAYLLSGDAQFKTKVNTLWESNTRSFNALQKKASLLTQKQRAAYSVTVELRAKFEPLFLKIISMRSQNDWNLSQHWVATKAAPLGTEIIQILQQMNNNQLQLLKTDQTRIKDDLDELLLVEWVLLGIGIVFSCLMAWVISKIIKQQIGGEPSDIMAFAGQLAKGHTDIKIQNHNNTATGILSSLYLIAESQKHFAIQANVIAEGNYNKDITPRSDLDTLGLAMQRMTQSLRETLEVVEVVAKGDLSRQIEAKGTDDLLAISMNKMFDSLRINKDENFKTNWLQKGQVSIAETLREENDINSLGEHFLQKLSEYVNAQVGAIYQWLEATDTETAHLELAATYAYTRRKQINNKFKLGEGLIGQAAKENKIIIVEKLPKEYIHIRSSLGEIKPRNLILVPFDYRGDLRGVLELGFVEEIDELTQSLLSSIRESLGAAFENIASQMRLAKQLQETQALANKIKLNEQRTSTIIESSLSAMITISTRGIIESCNQTTETLFGYSKEEMIGQNVKMLMPESIAVQHDGYLSHYQETGVTNIIGQGRELTARKKEGTEFYMHLSVSEMKLGNSISFLGVISDITEQVIIREKANTLLENLSISEQRTSTILESSLAGIITISDRGIIESCNKTTETLFGYSKEEMLGNNVKMLMPETRAKQHDGYLKNYQKTGEAKIIGSGREVIAKHKDGSEFHIHLSVAEMQLGDKLGYLGTILDITEQVEQREKVNQSNQELQATTEELETQKEELHQTNETLNAKTIDLDKQKQTLEISQNELQQQAQELEEASRYKSEFLANMSHELRTPLNSLLILSKLLAENEEGHLSEDEVESAQVIQESGANLLSMINDILDLSKVEAGHMKVHADAIAISELLLFLNNRFKHMAEDKGIKFAVNVQTDTPDIFVSDYSKLGQILTNLISNALKFTDQGSVILSITPSPASALLPEIDKLLTFTVTDTGIGITEQNQQSIFQAFQQADGSSNRKYGGTGLGLSIALSFAKLLGGDIQLVSEIGKGSQFTLFLPEILPSDEPLTAEPNSPATAQPGTTKATIALKSTPPPIEDDRNQLDPEKQLFLLIEDDANFAKIILDICHQQGAQILLAPDGETGLNLAQSYNITGIILDYKLPGLDGSDVLASLQSSETTRSIPVHMISAVEDLMDMHQFGGIGQITKPVSDSQIKMVLAKLRDAHELTEISLLIIEDDEAGAIALQKLLAKESENVSRVKTGTQAIAKIKEHHFSAIILDLNLPDMTGFELMQKLAEDELLVLPPVIVYTGKVLSDDEHLQLQHLTKTVVIKSARSPERLLDEVRLFIDHIDNSKKRQLEVVSQQANPAKLKNKNLLLVDDDMRNIFALAKVLRKKGLNVRIAPSGEAALKILDEQSDIELVLMDIMMPEMDGYETIQRIRSQQQFQELPIIALTANAMPGDKDKCLNAGANDYLAKPVDVEKLLLQMQIWL